MSNGNENNTKGTFKIRSPKITGNVMVKTDKTNKRQTTVHKTRNSNKNRATITPSITKGNIW